MSAVELMTKSVFYNTHLGFVLPSCCGVLGFIGPICREAWTYRANINVSTLSLENYT